MVAILLEMPLRFSACFKRGDSNRGRRRGQDNQGSHRSTFAARQSWSLVDPSARPSGINFAGAGTALAATHCARFWGQEATTTVADDG
jgi:hypothetical protein